MGVAFTFATVSTLTHAAMDQVGFNVMKLKPSDEKLQPIKVCVCVYKNGFN